MTLTASSLTPAQATAAAQAVHALRQARGQRARRLDVSAVVYAAVSFNAYADARNGCEAGGRRFRRLLAQTLQRPRIHDNGSRRARLQLGVRHLDKHQGGVCCRPGVSVVSVANPLPNLVMARGRVRGGLREGAITCIILWKWDAHLSSSPPPGRSPGLNCSGFSAGDITDGINSESDAVQVAFTVPAAKPPTGIANIIKMEADAIQVASPSPRDASVGNVVSSARVTS